MYWTLHMANVGVLGGFTLFSCGCTVLRLITRFYVSPGPENVKAVFAFTPDSVPEKFHTKILPLQWGETAERMPRGTCFFFGNPQRGKKFRTQIHQPWKNQQLPCVADERRSTGVWNEGWCKVGGITQRVLWMLKAWLSSSKGGADAAGAMCQLQQKIRSDYLSSLKTCAAKATV